MDAALGVPAHGLDRGHVGSIERPPPGGGGRSDQRGQPVQLLQVGQRRPHDDSPVRLQATDALREFRRTDAQPGRTGTELA